MQRYPPTTRYTIGTVCVCVCVCTIPCKRGRCRPQWTRGRGEREGGGAAGSGRERNTDGLHWLPTVYSIQNTHIIEGDPFALPLLPTNHLRLVHFSITDKRHPCKIPKKSLTLSLQEKTKAPPTPTSLLPSLLSLLISPPPSHSPELFREDPLFLRHSPPRNSSRPQ